MLTDDPNTPGDGKWEVNMAYLENAFIQRAREKFRTST